MKKNPMPYALLFVWAVLACTVLSTGQAGAQEHQHEKDHHHGHHKAYHGGVLNVIDKCEIGHLEVRIDHDVLEAWFVDGGKDTHRSVPIQASEVSLAVTLPDGSKKNLLLKADPMRLAGEKTGHCSHFSARADWLIEIREFEARGETEFKGRRRPLRIKYPAGYDPGHGLQ